MIAAGEHISFIICVGIGFVIAFVLCLQLRHEKLAHNRIDNVLIDDEDTRRANNRTALLEERVDG